MSTKEGNSDRQPTKSQLNVAEGENPIGTSSDVVSREIPVGVDRRTFLMRSAVVGAAAVMTGRSVSAVAAQAKPGPIPASAEPKGVAGGQVMWSFLLA